MKKIGFVLIAVGMGIVGFIVYSLFSQNQGIISPVPDDQGIKVIYKNSQN